MTIRNTLITTAATTALVLGGLSLAAPTLAQDDAPAGEKRENVDYFSMTFVDYKPGKANDAYEFISEHFHPTALAVGNTPPVTLHFQSGRYDAAYYWKQDGGLTDLEWVSTPSDAKWWAEFVRREGSEKKAEKALDEYYAMVASSLTVIGHRHLDEDEEEGED